MNDRDRDLDRAIAELRAALGGTPEAQKLRRFLSWVTARRWRGWLFAAVVLALAVALPALDLVLWR